MTRVSGPGPRSPGWSATLPTSCHNSLAERDTHAADRSGELDADLRAVQLQDHALLVLQLHAAGAGCERAASTDHRVASCDIAGIANVQGAADQLGRRGPDREADA